MERRLGVGRALVGGRWVDGDVSVDDEGRVAAVGLAPRRPTVRTAVPGFVDLQCNGVGAVDFAEADAADYAVAVDLLAAEGVVAVAPTLFSLPLRGYLDALGRLAGVMAESPGVRGAAARVEMVGAHLEGPFLARRWCGAHDPAHLVPPDEDVLGALLSAGPVHRMTLAPELAGADRLVARLRSAGVAVALGHTDADAATCRRAVDLGASVLTHAFNAHRRFTARDPGPAGVALADRRVTVTVIADGHHLAPETLRIVFAAASGRVAVVSDRVATPPGTPAGAAPPRTPAGRLAGAAASLDVALRHLLTIGIDDVAAVAAVSTTPARAVGWADHDLRPGSPARVALLDDRWEVLSTDVGP